MLREFLTSKLEKGQGASFLNSYYAIRRIHKDLELVPPEIDHSLVVAARKVPRKMPDVEPFPVALSFSAWCKDLEVVRFAAVITALACRLMLRPGELPRISLSDLRVGHLGMLIRLRARKCDKIIRADPWHFIECGPSNASFCLACALRTISTERVASLRTECSPKGADPVLENSPLFVDSNGSPIPPGMLGLLFNLVASSADASNNARFTGKSGRVGGATVAALGGVSELSIRTTGDWRSDTIRRYIGGIMASRSNLFDAMFEASAK